MASNQTGVIRFLRSVITYFAEECTQLFVARAADLVEELDSVWDLIASNLVLEKGHCCGFGESATVMHHRGRFLSRQRRRRLFRGESSETVPFSSDRATRCPDDVRARAP
ncbi:hypothetical protein PC128_g20607 [Phytophthora cactorum]|nr:hypothetical protein PC128_g20607 [Phytophthora cactorum]